MMFFIPLVSLAVPLPANVSARPSVTSVRLGINCVIRLFLRPVIVPLRVIIASVNDALPLTPSSDITIPRSLALSIRPCVSSAVILKSGARF